MPDPVIAVRGLEYQYPDSTVALRGIDFELFAGETVAVLGANGSGKTTFLLHLNGILPAQRGDIEVCSLRLNAANLARIRQRIGFVFQHSDDQLFMPTVLEDVAFGLLNAGVSENLAKEQAEAALAATGMAEAADKPPHHLSAGEKRRVALAGVLVLNPDILVLDEPTTFLDPPGQRDLLQLLKNLPQAKLIATHDIDFAGGLANRAVFFENGRISREGALEDLVRDFRWGQTTR